MIVGLCMPVIANIVPISQALRFVMFLINWFFLKVIVTYFLIVK